MLQSGIIIIKSISYLVLAMAKIRTPKETFTNQAIRDVVRQFPSLDCLSPSEREELYNREQRLVEFESKSRISTQVVDYVARWLSARPEFHERDLLDFSGSTQRKYFFRDSWEGSSLIAVKEGEMPVSEGFRMLLCHADSPCLRIKPRPIKLEWGPDLIYNYLGVRLSAVAHGGISVHNWVGQQVKIVGYTDGKNSKRVETDIPGVVGDYSAHADYREEEEDRRFPPERSLEIITGFESVKKAIERLGFSSIDDFSQARLYAVPTNEPQLIDDDSWRLLVGYGHDDRVGVFSAVDALIKTRNPLYTSIVWITGTEESGDNPPAGAGGHMLDLVLDHVLEKERRRKKNKFSITEAERRTMFLGSSMLIADVEISPYGHDESSMDAQSAAKIGLGVAISSDERYSSHSAFVGGLRRLALQGEKRGRHLCHQMCGEFLSQDKEDVAYHNLEGKERLYGRIGSWAWVGPPCASAHSHNEIICPADEFWTSRFYRRFLENRRGIES